MRCWPSRWPCCCWLVVFMRGDIHYCFCRIVGSALLAAYGRLPVRVVLGIHGYDLRSILPRALPYLLLMPQVNSMYKHEVN